MKPLWLGAAVLAVVLGACEEFGTDPGGEEPTGVVGAAGGTVATTDGKVVLVFPAGAVSSDTEVTVEAASVPQGDGLVTGTAYEFTPDGLSFAEPVSLSIRYDEASLAGAREASLRVHKQVSGAWQPVSGGSVDAAANVVTGTINGFSIYAIVLPGEAASVAAHAGDAQSAVVGQPVAVPPAVIVRTEAGDPLPGVAVSFTVTAGDGAVAGGSATTDESGIAAVESWTLGTAAGENALTATVSGLEPVVFTAEGTADAAAAVEAVAADAQTGPANHAVAEAPAVRVADAHGNAVADQTVTFAVASGGGSVTGGTATTDAEGLAAVGSWTLGAAGAQSLTATVEGLDPVTFTATAVDPCEYTAPYTLGTTLTSALSDADCLDSNGRYVEYYELDTDEVLSATFTMASDAFGEFIGAFDVAGAFVVTQYVASPGFTRAIIQPGTYRLAARSTEVGVGGSYTLAVVEADHGAVDECHVSANVYVTTGVSAAGQLTDGDCGDEFGAPEDRVDGYPIRLTAGETYTFTMTADAAAKLSFWAGNEHMELTGLSEAGTQSITYTATFDGWHSVWAIGEPGTGYEIHFEVGPAGYDPCAETLPYTLGTTVLGKLRAGDCLDSVGRWVEYYELVTDRQLEVSLGMGSGEFPPFIGAFDEAGTFVVTQYVGSPGFTRAVLAPGSYTLSARTAAADTGGVYHMEVLETSHDIDECSLATHVFVTAGVTTTGTLSANDCPDEFGDPNERWDEYNIRLVAGQTVTGTVTLEGAGKLSLWTGGEIVGFQERSDAGSLTIEYTATASGWHSFYPIGLPTTGYEISFGATTPAAFRAPGSIRTSAPQLMEPQR